MLEIVAVLPDHLVLLDDSRGMATLSAMLGSKSGASQASELLLASSGPFLLCTGFPARDRSETDGPAGTIVLARALASLQKEAVIVSWQDALDSWHGALGSLERRAIPQGARGMALKGTAVTIEAPGRAADRTYRNMRDEDISDRSPWFEDAVGDHALISVGDGGNEYGMGSAPERWFKARPVKRPVSTCDVLVIGQVSNWATLAIVATLSKRAKRQLLPTPEEYQTLLERLVAGGCIDGVTLQASATEDGFPSGKGPAIVQRLAAWAAS